MFRMKEMKEGMMAVQPVKAATICLSVSLALFFPRPAVADAVTDWNANAGDAALAACLDPFHESRLYAMVHVAIHDALNAINRRYRPYVFDVQGPAGASRSSNQQSGKQQKQTNR